MMKNLDQVNVGIIGTGGMGTRHARNLHTRVAGVNVAAVSDIDPERARQVAAECGTATVWADPYQLIQDADVEAILIASPDKTHVDYVLACLDCGKPVLCEKPLATTAQDAKQVVDSELALGGNLVAVGFMRRFDPQHLGVKRAVDSGAIGRPALFKGSHRTAGVPSDFPEEMVITNSAVHDIDSARWLLGQEIEEVYVRGVRTAVTLDADVSNLVLIQLSLSGPSLASIEVNVSAEYGYEVSAEVVAERGTALTTQPAQVIVRSSHNRSVPVPANWLERFQEAYVAELTNWVLSLRGGQFGGADAWDGYMSLLSAAACLKSLRTGRPEPVPVLSRPDLYN